MRIIDWSSDVCSSDLRGLAYQRGAGTGQRALIGTRPAQIQRFGRNAVEQGIAEEFLPLVMPTASAAMGQRLFEQRRIGELVASNRVSSRHHDSILEYARTIPPYRYWR